MAPRLTLSVSAATSGILASWPTLTSDFVGRHHVVVGAGVDHVHLAIRLRRRCSRPRSAGSSFHQVMPCRAGLFSSLTTTTELTRRVCRPCPRAWRWAPPADQVVCLSSASTSDTPVTLFCSGSHAGHQLGATGSVTARTPRARPWWQPPRPGPRAWRWRRWRPGLSPMTLRAICAAVPSVALGALVLPLQVLPDSKPFRPGGGLPITHRGRGAGVPDSVTGTFTNRFFLRERCSQSQDRHPWSSGNFFICISIRLSRCVLIGWQPQGGARCRGQGYAINRGLWWVGAQSGCKTRHSRSQLSFCVREDARCWKKTDTTGWTAVLTLRPLSYLHRASRPRP